MLSRGQSQQHPGRRLLWVAHSPRAGSTVPLAKLQTNRLEMTCRRALPPAWARVTREGAGRIAACAGRHLWKSLIRAPDLARTLPSRVLNVSEPHSSFSSFDHPHGNLFLLSNLQCPALQLLLITLSCTTPRAAQLHLSVLFPPSLLLSWRLLTPTCMDTGGAASSGLRQRGAGGWGYCRGGDKDEGHNPQDIRHH